MCVLLCCCVLLQTTSNDLHGAVSIASTGFIYTVSTGCALTGSTSTGFVSAGSISVSTVLDSNYFSLADVKSL